MYFFFSILSIIIISCCLPIDAQARVNILIGGLTVSYDYNDRQYAPPDPAEVEAERIRLEQREREREEEQDREEDRQREEEQDREELQELENSAPPTDPVLAQEREDRIEELREREEERETEREEAREEEEERLRDEQREETVDILAEDRTFAPRNNERVQTLNFAPFVEFTSSSQRDSVEFYYSPGFNYSHRDIEEEDHETEIDHDARVSAHRYFTRHWLMSFDNAFTYSDDPNRTIDDVETLTNSTDSTEEETVDTTERETSETGSQTELSNQPGRRRYLTNSLSLLSEYTYGPNSVAGLGYTWDILRNEHTGPGGYEDYDRHDAMVSLSHQFNPRYRASFEGHYVRGTYDPPEQAVVESVSEAISNLDGEIDPAAESVLLSSDLEEFHADLIFECNHFPHDPLSLAYGYLFTNFDEPLRDDSEIHELTLSWLHEVNPRSSFGLGGDGFTQRNFTGTDERGLVIFTSISGTASHTFTPDLSGLVRLSFRNEDREDPALGLARVLSSDDPTQTIEMTEFSELEEYNTQLYTAHISMSYSFLRYFSLTLGYTFSHQISDLIGDDYDDHRIFFSLSYLKELLRW